MKKRHLENLLENQSEALVRPRSSELAGEITRPNLSFAKRREWIL